MECEVCKEIREKNLAWRDHDCTNPSMLEYMDFIDDLERKQDQELIQVGKKQYWHFTKGWRRSKR